MRRDCEKPLVSISIDNPLYGDSISFLSDPNEIKSIIAHICGFVGIAFGTVALLRKWLVESKYRKISFKIDNLEVEVSGNDKLEDIESSLKRMVEMYESLSDKKVEINITNVNLDLDEDIFEEESNIVKRENNNNGFDQSHQNVSHQTNIGTLNVKSLDTE